MCEKQSQADPHSFKWTAVSLPVRAGELYQLVNLVSLYWPSISKLISRGHCFILQSVFEFCAFCSAEKSKFAKNLGGNCTFPVLFSYYRFTSGFFVCFRNHFQFKKKLPKFTMTHMLLYLSMALLIFAMCENYGKNTRQEMQLSCLLY